MFHQGCAGSVAKRVSVGSTVSGGLDSSSVACVARKYLKSSEPLHTFSLIFPSYEERIARRIDERPYMEAVLQTGGFEPHYVRADELSPLGKIGDVQRHLDEAFITGNLYLHWAMFETAKSHGVRIFLDGFDGDTTVSHGYEYLADLVRQFRWRTLRKEARLLSANLGLSKGQFLRNYCIKPFCPTWVYKTWRRLHGKAPTAAVPRTILAEAFKQRQGFEQRAKALVPDTRSCWRNAREKHWEMLNFPLYAQALEVADKASAAYQVEARYPFFDRRLIELCLALPPRLKLSEGWPRLILRRAMSGILPDKVCWRPTKGDLAPNFYTRLLDRDRQTLEAVILKDPSALEPYVDVPLLRGAYESCRRGPGNLHEDSMKIFSAVNLAIWLQTAGVRP